ISPGAVSIDTVASPMNDAALQPLSSAGIAAGGVFTFNGQAIQRAGSGYVLRVTIPAGGGLGGMAVSKVTAPFDVKHAAATQMTVTSSPTMSPYTAGAGGINASFTLRDMFNNVVDSMGDQVS